METMTAITIIIILLLGYNEFVMWKTYGKYVADPNLVDLTGYELNGFDKNIMGGYNLRIATNFISKTNSLMCSYFINNIGLVLRGSKLHYKIKAKFKELNSK